MSIATNGGDANSSQGRLVSPADLLAAAKAQMLDGRDPRSRDEWVAVLQFFAVNIHREVAVGACSLLAAIYHMPLSPEEVTRIVQVQLALEIGT